MSGSPFLIHKALYLFLFHSLLGFHLVIVTFFYHINHFATIMLYRATAVFVETLSKPNRDLRKYLPTIILSVLSLFSKQNVNKYVLVLWSVELA